jgi:ATP-dependent Clp protease ATP-binding subunit ClpC
MSKVSNNTDRVNKVLDMAQGVALEYGDFYVGTEHLLISLAREGYGVAANVLKELGVTVEQIEAATQKLLGKGPTTKIVEFPS